jgi:hypothetical protein
MFISVPLEEWADLQAAANKLAALEAAGVDNWEGYDSAMDALSYEESMAEQTVEAEGTHGG